MATLRSDELRMVRDILDVDVVCWLVMFDAQLVEGRIVSGAVEPKRNN